MHANAPTTACSLLVCILRTPLPSAASAGDEYQELVVQGDQGRVYAAMLESAAQRWVVREISRESCTVSFTNKPSWKSLRRLTISAVCREGDDGTTTILLADDNNGAWGQGKSERKKFATEVTARLERTPAPSSTSPAMVAQPVVPAGPVNPTPSGAGVFVIESTPPGAEVYVDGEFVGSTPIAEHGLAAGRHEIELRKKGWAEWKRQLSVSAGSRARVAAEMESESPAPPQQPQPQR